MNSLRYLISLAALAFTLPAHAATTDPEVVIYGASGVADGGSGSNTATAFSCTPFSGVTENIRFVIRAQTGALLTNSLFGVAHLNTQVVTTGGAAIFGNFNVATGVITGGTVAIAATSTSVACTAMIIQPNNLAPVGIQLHMIRFNPLAGTTE